MYQINQSFTNIIKVLNLDFFSKNFSILLVFCFIIEEFYTSDKLKFHKYNKELNSYILPINYNTSLVFFFIIEKPYSISPDKQMSKHNGLTYINCIEYVRVSLYMLLLIKPILIGPNFFNISEKVTQTFHKRPFLLTT